MNKKILIAAHRGLCAGNIPYNSLLAFKSALKLGADIIELDTLKSLDGTMWVFHTGNEFVHIGQDVDLTKLHDEEIKRFNYINCGDRCRTLEKIERLDDTLDYLKDKALINVDRSWDNLEDTINVIKRVGAEDAVILKSPDEKKYVDEVEALAPDIKYMPIIKTPEILEYARTKKMNVYGAEVLFDSEDNILCSEKFLDEMHRRGEHAWVNGIDINFHYVFAANHNDTVSISEDPDKGWGWLIEKGFDIIQTDFPFELNIYMKERNK